MVCNAEAIAQGSRASTLDTSRFALIKEVMQGFTFGLRLRLVLR